MHSKNYDSELSDCLTRKAGAQRALGAQLCEVQATFGTPDSSDFVLEKSTHFRNILLNFKRV